MEDAETVGLSVHFQDPNFLRQLQREATQGDGMFEDASVRARRLIVDMAAHISKWNRTAFDRSPSSATRVSRTASQSAFVPQSSLTHSVVHAPSSARSPTGSSYRVGSSAKKKTRAAAEGSMAWLRLHRSQKVERVREIVRALESCSHILLTDLQREWCLPPGDIDERDRPVTDWNLDRQREELVQTRNSVVDALSHLEAFIAESFTQAEKRLIGGNTHRLQSAKARANQFQYHRSDDKPFPSYLDPETYSVKHSPPPATFYDSTKPKGANRVPVPTSSLSGRHSPNDASATQQRSRPTFVEEQPPAAATSSAEPARSLPPVAARTGSQESLDFDGGESPDDTSAIVGAAVDTAGHTPPPQGPSGTDRGASFPAARPLDFGSPAVGGADPPPAMADSAAASVENFVAVEPQATTSAPVPPPSSNAGVARKIVVQPTAQKSSPAQSGGATPQYASPRPAVRRAEPVVVQPEPNGPGQPPTTQPSSTVVPVVTSQQEQAPSSNQGLAPRVVVQPGSAARRSPSVPPSSAAAPAHVGRPAELQSSPPPQTASPAQLLLRNLARHSDSDSEEDRAGA